MNIKELPASGVIDTPGLYDLPASVYHGDPTKGGSLAQSACKVLLDDGGPAKFKAAQTEPREPKAAWDFGTAVHALILGKGEEQVEVCQFDNWRTKDARAARTKAQLAGKTPLLPSEYQQAAECAAALNEDIADYFTGGYPEVSMFWRDGHGQWLRGQMDYYRAGDMIVDLKTMADVSDRAFERAVWDYRYYLQAAWYRTGVYELTGELLDYYIVGIEKKRPYLSKVRKLDEEYLEVGEAHMHDVLALYRECAAADNWPGCDPEAKPLAPPPWAYSALSASVERELEERLANIVEATA